MAYGTDRPRGQARDETLRAQLTPLKAGERPPALLIAILLSSVLAIAVIVGALSVHELSRHGGSLLGGIFLGAVLGTISIGMYRRLYWAVLAFQALIAFQVLVGALALVVASTILAAILCLASIVLGGWLFWKLVRVMGRIQASTQGSEENLR